MVAGDVYSISFHPGSSLNQLYQVNAMNDKNPALLIVLCVSVGLILGFGVGYIAKPIPEPVIEVTVHGVYVNGKHVNLDAFKLPVPLAPDKGRRKPGDLPAGDLPGPVSSKPAAFLDCPCGLGCTCEPCHCHASKPIVFTDEPAITGQRSPKPVEAFGIETLVAILKEFKEAVFGVNGNPGLKDDITNGLRGFWDTVRIGFIVAGGVTLGLLSWCAISLQRIADHSAAKVAEVKALRSIALAGN